MQISVLLVRWFMSAWVWADQVGASYKEPAPEVCSEGEESAGPFMASLQTNVTDSNRVQSHLYYLIITSLMGPPLSVLWNIFLVRALLQRCEIYISDEEHTTHFLNTIPTGINLVCLFFFFQKEGEKSRIVRLSSIRLLKGILTNVLPEQSTRILAS